jgi:3-methyladenine DNA glycosylase AlkD
MPLSISIPAVADTPSLRKIAKAWAKAHNDLAAPELEKLVTALIHDPSAIRKTMAGILLGYLPAQRREFRPALFEDWLAHLDSWAAVDAVCYNNFTAAEMLDNFTLWKTLIIRLAKADNLHKCRGAIVLLTKPVKQSADPRLRDLSFRVIDLLRGEKDILITKAVSWLLRHLTKHHAPDVTQYLDNNRETLPAVAIRETLNKLKHGTKTIKKQRP